MSVSVSLLRLVCVEGTRDLWPSEFSDLVAKCEENPADRTPFGVTADWLQEEVAEDRLAEAFRWMFKRTEVEIVKDKVYGGDAWAFRRMPNSMGDVPNPHFIDRTHIAGMMADLAYRLQKLREDLA